MFSIDEMLSKRNQKEAFAYLQRKKNSCGADGMPLFEIENYWKMNNQKIIETLKVGTYEPGVIKCTEIVSNKGKRREISNLCAVDRFISRLLYQKLRRYIEPEFLEHSYAYQENKGVLEAVKQAQQYLEQGDKYVVEIDLKSYFDMIPHEPMMRLIKKRITDDAVVRLIEKYVRCSMLVEGKLVQKEIGLVQGNAISTVLSNLYLQRLDQFLEDKGYDWIRFADNIDVYCINQEEAKQIYKAVQEVIESLALRINENKSGIYTVLERPLLGYQFYKYAGKYEVRRFKYKKTTCYHNWHESALKKVNQEYHIVAGGVLNKKDYALIFENETEKCDIPIGVVDQLNIYSDITIASNALQLISQKKIRLSIVDKYGNSLGNYIPEGYWRTGKEFLKQASFYESSRRFQIAQKMEIAGIHNLRANIRYYNRKNEHQLDEVVKQLTECMELMRTAKDIEKLMLLEARARQVYYPAFNVILKQKEFQFEKRTRRPPKDEINALISFGNTLLYNMVLQAIWKTPLDPRIGVVHATSNRNYSLNLDFADLFKPVIVDRVIFSLVNLLQLQASQLFQKEDSGAIYLNKEGKRIFIRAFEDKLADRITVKDINYTYKQLIEAEVQKFHCYIAKGEKYKPYKYW